MDKKNKIDAELEMAEKENLMVAGSAWMTTGSFVSRLLGAFYIIPWMMWIGDPETGAAANALYQVAYVPYAFFVSFAAAGVPSAISKEVSYYNALGRYDISKKIYSHGLILMGVTGIFSAVALYILAPWFTGPISDKSVAIYVIRSLAPALLIIPLQAAIRGFIQGHNRMKEPAISQIIEQLARVAFILGSVYIIRQLQYGAVEKAVAYSTFAAFVGAIFSIIYLLFLMKQIPTALSFGEKLTDELTGTDEVIDTMALLLNIIKTSIPFIIIATGITIFQLIDQLTYAPLMRLFTDITDGEIELTFGLVSANGYKLSTLLTSFGASMAITTVPLISDLMATKNYQQVRHQFEKGIQLLLFVMLPGAMGMIAVAQPLYTIFFGPFDMGSNVTRLYAVVSVFMAMYLLLGNILQSVNQRRKGIYALIIGFLAKLIVQPLMIYFTHAYGMLWSTLIGLLVTVILMLKIMYETIPFSKKFLMRRSLFLLILSLIMFIVTFGVEEGLGYFLKYDIRLQSFVALILIALVGGFVYTYLVLKTKIADRLIGERAATLRKKLRIRV
ncbi:putative polysaccharide biosynthesis protein [Allofustis seminis]|uniref:putative polysaccharide biosynthesis protein n=1 Tax=Allofustis seminis TaxID=166939 RepID=UPI00058C63C5|nr:polysaccharide biosynthesis protein [Allofustis seminis]